MKLGREHLEAVNEAVGDAQDEAKAEREVAGFNAGSQTWVNQHHGRAKLADARAARLSEIAAHIAANMEDKSDDE